MTDPIKDESGQPLVSAELPTPTFTEPGVSETLPLKATEIEKRFKMLEKQVSDAVKLWQSDKDRRLPQVESNIRAILEELNQLKSDGFSEGAAITLMERLGSLTNQQEPPPHAASTTAGTAVPQQAVADALAELAKHDLSSNDPAFLQMLRGQYRNPDAFKASVMGYIIDKKVAPVTTASPAGIIQGAAINAPKPDDEATLIQNYKAEMQAARGKREQGKAIQAKYRQKGLDISQIPFTV